MMKNLIVLKEYSMDIKIIVAAHKVCEMPTESMYYPIHVGAYKKPFIGYQKDCEGGAHISQKNPTYCELTGIYWAWKHLKADYIGLVHYRRLFRSKGLIYKKTMKHVLKQKQLEKMLKKWDLILPKKRNYMIESVYSHYCHTHYQKDLDEAGRVVKELYPDYYEAYQKRMQSRSAHMFNMFIMKWELFDQYCSWIFPLLEELEKRLDLTGYTPFEARVYGRISELMLDVWIEKNQLTYKEIPFMYIGKVDWGKKIMGFLKAKFWGVRYTESF
ncbi:MAG: DUF4422 domain-containing protein [Lachnospiraceae bacterium]